MATVKEFKEWLNRFPDDAIVEVGIQQKAPAWESCGAVNFEEFTLTDSDYGSGWEFVDLRNNQFVKEDSPSFGKCYLRLGESD